MARDCDGEPLVLYGWHHAVYNLWAEALSEFKTAWFTGRESATQKKDAVERFIARETPLLIVSLRSGSGLDGLQKVCSRVAIGELDWSPGALEQCIGRIHRDGQPDPVMAYYLVTDAGCDSTMEDALGLKRAQIDGVREPFGEITSAKEADPEHVKKLAEAYLHQKQGPWHRRAE